MPLYNPPTAGGGVAIADTAATVTDQTVVFSNSNGVSFGLSGSTMTGSHNALTSQSNQAFSADASSTFQTLSFQDSNGISFSNNAGAVRLTHGLQFTSNTSAITSNAMHSTSRPAFSADASSTFQTLTFQNSNLVSFSNNAGAIRVTHDLMPSTSRPAFSADASSTFQTLTFQNSNNVSFSNNAGAIRITHNLAGTSTGFTGANISGSMTHNSSGLALSLSVAGGGAVVSNAIQDVSTATGSGTNTSRFAADDHVHRGVRGIAANGTASTFFGDFVISAGNNVTLSTGGNSTAGSVAIHVAAPGGAATYSNVFTKFPLAEGVASATTTASDSQLFVQPFSLPVNLSFGQINMIGSHAFQTSAGNTFSFRLTPNTNMRLVGNVTVTNSHLFDFFLFSKGTGGYSSELETVASTRNTIIEYLQHTWDNSVNHTAGSTGSVSVRQTVSISMTYPMMTSATQTSVNPASTFTVWGTGTSSWSGTASNSTSQTYNTTNTASTSIASTHPAITEWSSYKLWPFAFGTSITPGEWCLGIKRNFSTSSSLSTANTNATGTGNSYTSSWNASALTQSGSYTWVGRTDSLASSLGWPGQNTANSLPPTPGLGSFSGTWDKATTYLNNAGNPAGAIAYTQLRTHTSYFETWFQLASNRI